jgi:hypothetical protein
LEYTVVKAPRDSKRRSDGEKGRGTRFSNGARIASWASCKSAIRSSWVYWGWSAAGSGGFDEMSDDSGIALLAPAENEGSTSAFFYLVINLLPESNEIVARGPERQHHHEPDRHERDPVHRKEISVVDGPLLPAMVENYRHDGDNLHNHFELAEIAGFNREAFGSGNAAQPTDQELPADYDDGDPGCHQRRVELNQGDESGSNEQLVGQWVEQHSNGGDLATFAGDVAVDPVGNRSDDKQNRGEQFLLAIDAGEARSREHPDEQWDAEDTGERDGIRKVHNLATLLNYAPRWGAKQRKGGPNKARHPPYGLVARGFRLAYDRLHKGVSYEL